MTDQPKISSRIEALFAVPFGAFTLNQPEPLCSDLRELFLARERLEQTRNEIKRLTQSPEVFESRFDLFTWPEPPVQALRAFCHASLLGMLRNIGALGADADVEFNYHAWFHITRTGGYQGLHNHQNASWSGIFCVDPGDSDPQHKDSGLVRFHDPRGCFDMYADAANENIGPPFVADAYNVAHRAGQLIVFPSYLYHEIFAYLGTRPRIVVAFNCMAHSAAR